MAEHADNNYFGMREGFNNITSSSIEIDTS